MDIQIVEKEKIILPTNIKDQLEILNREPLKGSDIISLNGSIIENGISTPYNSFFLPKAYNIFFNNQEAQYLTRFGKEAPSSITHFKFSGGKIPTQSLDDNIEVRIMPYLPFLTKKDIESDNPYMGVFYVFPQEFMEQSRVYHKNMKNAMNERIFKKSTNKEAIRKPIHSYSFINDL